MFHFFGDPLQASNWQAKDLRIFRYLEAGISHLLEDHFGDSNLECWSQCVSSTLTAIVFKLLCRSMAGFNLIGYIFENIQFCRSCSSAGGSFWRQQLGMLESVCQCPLITTSCLPVTMESTNSLIFKHNNSKKLFSLGGSFWDIHGALYRT